MPCWDKATNYKIKNSAFKVVVKNWTFRPKLRHFATPAVDKAISNGRMDSGQASYAHGGALEACALMAAFDKD